MDRITINQLANEFNVQSQVVIGELKKLGIYVAATASVEPGLADRVRKKLQARKEMEQAALQQAEEKKAAKKAAPTKEKEKEAKPRRLVTKSRKPVEKAETPAPEEPKPIVRLAPRKGRLKAADYLPAAEVSEAAVIGAPEEKTAKAQPVEKEIHGERKKKTPPVAETAVEPKEEVPAPVSAKPLVSVPAPERGKVPPIVPVEKPLGPSTTERKIAAEVPPQRVGSPVPRVQKPLPPAPKVVKPQILKKTVAEGPAVPNEISEKILKIPTERPPLDRTQERGRFVKPRRDKEQVKKAAPPVPAARHKEPLLPPIPKELKPVNLPEGINVKELAERLDIKAKYIMQKLLQKGIFTTINQTLDAETVKQISAEFGYIPNILSFEEEVAVAERAQDRPEENEPRPPVVTIMGHVDHGKTTLLDAIRESRITEKEAGGITQHIGAYKVNVKDFSTNGQAADRNIVFLDTPGHEAFTRMRSRGAQVTDIVILVVAADDGVMPQTVEAIHHAKAASVPIIVAINKIDKPNAQPDRVKQQLTEHGLMPEAWGGDTVTVDISAKNRINIDLLMEMILLVADLRELKANPRKPASGVVLEARLDRTRGAVATVLVQNGTLHIGDTFLAGAVYGKVRAMFDDRGRGVKEAPPSTPVEVLGMEGVPQAGDRFMVIEDIDKIKKISLYRQSLLREKRMVKSARLTLDQLYEQLKHGNVKELPLILKADVQGSVEVLTDTLNKLSTEKVKVRIIHSGTGAITESDVLLASASNAIIIGFNVRPERKAAELAEQENVDIRLHTIIYNITNEIRNAMVGLLETTYKEKRLGTAEVRTTFRVPGVGTIAGSYVSSGLIKRGASVRLLRDNVVIYEGKISSLRRFKEDVDEVKNGYECGVGLERFNDIKDHDVIEAFVVEKVQPTASQL